MHVLMTIMQGLTLIALYASFWGVLWVAVKFTQPQSSTN